MNGQTRRCRAEASVDCNSIEIRVTWRVVREVVRSLRHLRDNVRSLTQHQPRDVQADAEHQHSQHSQITAHTKATEREREQGGRLTAAAASVCCVLQPRMAGPGVRAVGELAQHAERTQPARSASSLSTAMSNQKPDQGVGHAEFLQCDAHPITFGVNVRKTSDEAERLPLWMLSKNRNWSKFCFRKLAGNTSTGDEVGTSWRKQELAMVLTGLHVQLKLRSKENHKQC
ncbi:hypothetical protein EYF80_030299 [Liparis tanakae]|uniref:Uncharacterized protein n=1 Tax=Liparis tanakae TaxID=230148 RepID=A0A4Z2H3T3_9TELE|nr:hypothetical protein EYF80_030299 [Liparis tanakae]